MEAAKEKRAAKKERQRQRKRSGGGEEEDAMDLSAALALGQRTKTLNVGPAKPKLQAHASGTCLARSNGPSRPEEGSTCVMANGHPEEEPEEEPPSKCGGPELKEMAIDLWELWYYEGTHDRQKFIGSSEKSKKAAFISKS